MTKEHLLALLRISLGCIFTWAFKDKLFGLGFATSAENAWLNGVSPTQGYLLHATQGPFADIFKQLAGNPVVDGLFMLGLLGIGIALVLGIGLTIAAWAGTIQMGLIYLSHFPPINNPLFDEHLIYILVFWVLAYYSAGDYWGLGRWWKQQPLVQKYSFLT
jgi:thiosulfate dehydrogenase [quinone] large subunit